MRLIASYLKAFKAQLQDLASERQNNGFFLFFLSIYLLQAMVNRKKEHSWASAILMSVNAVVPSGCFQDFAFIVSKSS